ENGYRTALLEQTDFGAGVTSRSTRLIHGGLRYLEHGQVRVVRESLREREALLEEFPYQVKPLPFLVPVYESDSRRPWYIRTGLEAYYWIGHSRRLARYRPLGPDEVVGTEPGLKQQSLRAGFLYYDCQAIYPERLALEMALTAEEGGADVRNHTRVSALLMDSRDVARVIGVRTADGQEYEARMVVNATGPWVDEVRRLLPNGARSPADNSPPLP